MSRATAIIHAGVCGFVTEVCATADDDVRVTFQVTSPCENIQRLAGHLSAVDAYVEVGAGYDGQIHQAARASLRGCCSGCVVPSGIFKAMQIAAGVALPRDAGLHFEAKSWLATAAAAAASPSEKTLAAAKEASERLRQRVGNRLD